MPASTPRKSPQRTCIACRSTGDKRALIRIVRTPHGVEVDETGKLAGRGAYLCHQPACWQVAVKKNRLDSALKTRLSPDEKLRITEFATTLQQAVV